MRRAFFQERAHAFLCFRRFTRLHVMRQSMLDVLLHRGRPELFEEAFGIRHRAGRVLQKRIG